LFKWHQLNDSPKTQISKQGGWNGATKTLQLTEIQNSQRNNIYPITKWENDYRVFLQAAPQQNNSTKFFLYISRE